MAETEGTRLGLGLEGCPVQDHPRMHLATRVSLDHQMNHQPEITLVLKRWRRTTEPLEVLRNLFNLRNLQLVSLNLPNLERMPILDDTIASNRNPVLLARGLGRRLDHASLKTRVLSKHNPILVILRKLTGCGRLLVVLNANVLQSTNPLILTTRDSMGHNFRKICVGKRQRIP